MAGRAMAKCAVAMREGNRRARRPAATGTTPAGRRPVPRRAGSSIELGEPASRGAEPIHLGRARRTAERAGIAARASNPINPVVAGTGGGLINAGESELTLVEAASH